MKVHQPEIAIVGGGIAGASLATVLARAGREVMLLEQQQEYGDRVRGEYLANWGVLEARELGLEELFRSVGAATARYRVPYDELIPPGAADSNAQDTSALLPGVDGGICASHPAVCRALADAAATAGAVVIRGVTHVQVEPGPSPCVAFHNGTATRLRPRLVIGADGRNSTVRKQIGFELRHVEPTHVITGMLVDGMTAWPEDRFTAGTEGDLRFLIFPQPGGRQRLYTCASVQHARRWAGPDGSRRFLATFASLTCLPNADRFRSARIVGPCATFAGGDTWTQAPFVEGVVLIGDAAGHNDPCIGQGLSLAMRDVRVLSEILLESDDWSPSALSAYDEERRERLCRQRRVAATYAKLFATFTEEARARRARFFARARSGDEVTQLAFRSMYVGPHRLPAEVFTDEFHDSVLA